MSALAPDTKAVQTWAWTVAVTDEARRDLRPDLDDLLIQRARQSVPAGFVVLGEPLTAWARDLLGGWTDEETGEWVRGPEWMFRVWFRVVTA